MATASSTPDNISRIDGVKTQTTAAPVEAPVANRIESHSLAQSGSKEARHTMIAEAAYHRAQQRGFAHGDEWQDWFDAEREVDALLDPDL